MKLVGIIFALFALFACGTVGFFHQKDGSGEADSEQTITDDGTGAYVKIPRGSLSDGTEIVMEEGADLITDEILSGLAIDEESTSAGPSVNIAANTSLSADEVGQLQIGIPLDSNISLNLASTILVVVYHVTLPDGTTVMGIITEDNYLSDGSHLLITAVGVGNYQAVLIEGSLPEVLQVETDYEIKTRAEQDEENSGSSVSLETPTNLQASLGAPSTATISLSWDDTNTGEDGYKVERSLNSNSGFSEVVSLGINETSYEDEFLNDNTTYYYRVYAFYEDQTSDSSNVASATTADDPSIAFFGSDTAANDKFGTSIGVSGSSHIVGAPGESGQGAAYIYVHDPSDSSWHVTKLTASDGAAGDEFGASVAIYGMHAVVGAPEHNNQGAVYIYRYDVGDNIWRETKESGFAVAADRFGVSVAVAGNLVAVGSPGDDAAFSNSGSAYIFQFDPSTNDWDLTNITPTGASLDAAFGSSVALFENKLIVGEPGASSDEGKAYAFSFDSGGNAWTEYQAFDPGDGASSDLFGSTVGVYGNTYLVGAPGHGGQGAVYIYQFEDDGTQGWHETKVTASDGLLGDSFGCAVSMAPQRAVVGACHESTNGINAGALYLYDFDVSNGNWIESKPIFSNGSGMQLGTAVAAAGQRIVIGEPENASQGQSAGGARLYHVPTISSEVIRNASDEDVDDRFADNLSISGNTVIVGAKADNDGATDSGSVYIYQFDASDSSWPETKLNAASLTGTDFFGNSVSISGDWAIVGARQRELTGSNRGTATIFGYDAFTQNWYRELEFSASDGLDNDRFGSTVAISGHRAAVGVPDRDDNGATSGAIYIYTFDTNDQSWNRETKLDASDGATNDSLGSSIAISGEITVAGAPYDDDSGSNSGSAYIYTYDPSVNTWEEIKITASDGAANDNFGWSVAVSGNRVAVGAYRNNSNAGAVYIFDYDPSAESWVESDKLVGSGVSGGDYFGSVVSLSHNKVISSSYAINSNTGAAYLFQFDPSDQSWVETEIITSSNGAASDQFGFAVGISEDHIAIGADRSGGSAGSTYLYNNSP